jgi:segregation and condensation protein B
MRTRSDDEIKEELYAVLFSVGKRTLLSELAKLVKVRDHERVQEILLTLRKELEDGASPLALMIDGEEYKLNVQSKFMGLVQKVVKQTELPKSVLETLAVIAYKTPLLQSDLVKIRTNKAYEHLKELEALTYITREKHGRTKLIRLTQKFYEYFEISPEELQKKFQEAKVKEDGEQQTKLEKPLEVYGTAKELEPSYTKKEEPHLPNDEDEGGSLFIDQPKEESQAYSTPEPVLEEYPEPKKDSFSKDKQPLESPVEEPTITQPPEETTKSTDDDYSTPKKDEKEEVTEKSSSAPSDYEPIKVKGGFTEFSEEEKEKIKNRRDEIEHGSSSEDDQ